jgi:flagellar basal body-associated protein FliL
MIMKISIILLVVIALIAIPAVILANSNDNDNEEEVTDMNGKANLPLIDTMKPVVTKTATFALG